MVFSATHYIYYHATITIIDLFPYCIRPQPSLFTLLLGENLSAQRNVFMLHLQHNTQFDCSKHIKDEAILYDNCSCPLRKLLLYYSYCNFYA